MTHCREPEDTTALSTRHSGFLPNPGAITTEKDLDYDLSNAMRERKMETRHLAPMRMIRTVRRSLPVLRGYLLLVTALVLHHVLVLAGLLHGGI